MEVWPCQKTWIFQYYFICSQSVCCCLFGYSQSACVYLVRVGGSLYCANLVCLLMLPLLSQFVLVSVHVCVFMCVCVCVCVCAYTYVSLCVNSVTWSLL